VTTAERFELYVVKIPFSECWHWIGALNQGYGQFSIKGRGHRAHRVAYERWVGPILPGLTLDHKCRNRACVRPDHLEPVDNTTNVLRGLGRTAVNAAKTHCIHGHAFTPENTLPAGTRKGRSCRTCKRASEARRPWRQRDYRKLPLCHGFIDDGFGRCALPVRRKYEILRTMPACGQPRSAHEPAR
jgi:hypothetical protein